LRSISFGKMVKNIAHNCIDTLQSQGCFLVILSLSI
jgi:hypothetical protein